MVSWQPDINLQIDKYVMLNTMRCVCVCVCEGVCSVFVGGIGVFLMDNVCLSLHRLRH